MHRQVYRATLRATGEEVAVKVQRPGIGESIAVDMLLLRWVAPGACWGVGRGVVARVQRLGIGEPIAVDMLLLGWVGACKARHSAWAGVCGGQVQWAAPPPFPCLPLLHLGGPWRWPLLPPAPCMPAT